MKKIPKISFKYLFIFKGHTKRVNRIKAIKKG